MAFTTISQGAYRGFPFVLTGRPHSSANSTTLDAAGEEDYIVGRLYHHGGPGTTKTISSAGGAIWFKSDGTTFANAGSTYRLGIQDVNLTTGLPDGTFDVYGDMVGGTDAIGTTGYQKAMGTGSKTITYGDIVAVGCEVQSRAGADSVAFSNVIRSNFQVAHAYGVVDTGSGRTKNAHPLNCHILFDDGTYGWFEWSTETPCGVRHGSTFTIHTGLNPDEYGLKFSLPFACRALGFELAAGAVVSGDDLEGCFYSDPLGSPSLIEAVTFDPDLFQGSGAHMLQAMFSTPRELAASTAYGMTVRPTTTNSITFNYMILNAAGLRSAMFPVGTNGSLISRDGNTGAFTETTTQMPYATLWIDQIDLGSGGLIAGNMRGGFIN